MTKTEYNSILKGVYERASTKKELVEFVEGLPCYRISELREMMKDYRLKYKLNPKMEIYNDKSKAADVEITKRFLNTN